MAILTATGLEKYYGAQDIFSGLSFEINHGDKIALLGPNGVGKTTLLRILCGLETPTAGRVSRAKNLRIGYLAQEAALSSEQTLFDEMLAIFRELLAQRDAIHRMEEAMGIAEASPELMERYGKAVARFEAAGGYEYEHRIQRVLSGLGFPRQDFQKPVAILSGGQKTRAQLAKLLLQDPQLLLLDEPTNHLDLAATEWLEKYLQNWPGSLVLVAHDRYFLDKVVNRVVEMSAGSQASGVHLERYRGNYSHYVAQRAERAARRWKEYRQQQEHIAKTEDFIRRYMSGQRSREAKGRLKRLERLERLEHPREHKTIHVSLRAHFRSGNDVLVSEGLTVGYAAAGTDAAHVLFSSPPLLLRRLQRVALLGPNGSGKTTFLKTILGQVPPLAGELRLGPSVRVCYLAQSYEDLNPNNTILDEILAVVNLPLSEARNFLGRFLFSGDDVYKPISSLSGGERGRVALAKLTMQGANFLLLDEPTNHLDIASQEILEQVLRDFEGTILFVSHDRYLIDALATHLWVIEDNALRVYKGNYSTYVAQREREAQEEATARALREAKRRQERKANQGKVRIRREKEEKVQEAAELEAAIVDLEGQLETLEQELAAASMAQRVDKIRELGRAHASVERELHVKLSAWAEIGHE